MNAINMVVRRGGEAPELTVVLEKKTDPAALNSITDLPDWAKLSCHKCPHCPLAETEVKWCPVAASISPTIQTFSKWLSTDPVELETTAGPRRVIEKMTATAALSSIFAYQIVYSACPVMQFDFWLWKYFDPTLSIENVLFRKLAIRLIYKDLSARKGREFQPAQLDMADLLTTLELQIKRIHEAQDLTGDAVPNALVQLHGLTTCRHELWDDIYDQLEEGLSEST